MADLTLQCGVASSVRPGDEVCGDREVVCRFDGGAVIAAVDGIGHGEQAAAAARTAAQVIAHDPHESPIELLQRCHAALRHTRGVVLSVASLDLRHGSLRWAGVGNVTGVVWRGDSGRYAPREELLLRAGVVGLGELPVLYPVIIPWQLRDTLVFATDGIRANFPDGLLMSGSSQALADRILAQHRHGNDDALVLVVRAS